MVRVRSHATVEEFWSLAGPLLSANPVRHTVEVGIVGRLARGVPYSDQPPIFVTVHADGDPARDVIGSALCTPPYPLLVSALPVLSAPAVADHLRTLGATLAGVNGTRPEADAFGAAWVERTGLRMVTQVSHRLYRLGELVVPSGVPGAARPAATENDVDLIARWRAEFAAEALGRSVDPDTARSETRRARAGGSHPVMWCVDGTPVGYAVVGRPVAGMSRIGPVYTPPARRGHGYGSAVTAAAGRWALDQGAAHVVLFTDVANPIANSIYQRIGFRPVADALEAAFAPGALP